MNIRVLQKQQMIKNSSSTLYRFGGTQVAVSASRLLHFQPTVVNVSVSKRLVTPLISPYMSRAAVTSHAVLLIDTVITSIHLGLI